MPVRSVRTRKTKGYDMPTEPTESNGAVEPSLAEDRLSRILAKRIEVARIQRIVDERSASLKAAKEALADASSQLLAEIDDDQGCLPFDESELWKSARIECLGIPKVLVDALHESQIDTIGDIITLSDSGRYFEDIKGIGPEASATICSALERYWELHPRVENVDGDDGGVER